MYIIGENTITVLGYIGYSILYKAKRPSYSISVERNMCGEYRLLPLTDMRTRQRSCISACHEGDKNGIFAVDGQSVENKTDHLVW
jgi:hypothetical protein